MKNLRYKGGADVRRFNKEALNRVGIDEDALEFNKANGSVVKVKDDSANKLLEMYPNDFEVVDKDEAQQLQLGAQAKDEVQAESSSGTADPADTVETQPAGSTRSTRGATR